MAAITSTMPEPQVALVSVEEYMDRFVDGGEKPACEYVDGERFPKSIGTKKHSKTQQNIQSYLRQRYGEAWVIDPERKAAWEYTPEDTEPRRATDVLTAGPITLTLDQVFEHV